MSILSKLRGVTETLFQLGLGGPNLKNNAGVLQARNATDSAFARMSGADPVTDDDFVTKRFGASSVIFSNLTTLAAGDVANGLVVTVLTPPSLWQRQKNSRRRASPNTVVAAAGGVWEYVSSLYTPGLPYGTVSGVGVYPPLLPSDIAKVAYYLAPSLAPSSVTLAGSAIVSINDIAQPPASAAVTDQGVAGHRPTLVTGVAALTGKRPGATPGSVVQSDGVANWLYSNNAIFQPGAASSYWVVFGQSAWANNSFIAEFDGNAECTLLQRTPIGAPAVGPAGQVSIFDAVHTAALNNGATLMPALSAGPFHSALITLDGAGNVGMSVDGGPGTTGLCNQTTGAGGGLSLFANNGGILPWAGQLVEVSAITGGIPIGGAAHLGLLSHCFWDYGMVPRNTSSLILGVGDSNMADSVATGAPSIQSWPAILQQRLLGGHMDLRNCGAGGNTFANAITNIASTNVYLDDTWDLVVSPVMLGTNDFNTGASSATVIANATSFCGSTRTAAAAAGLTPGTNYFIFLCTVIADAAASGSSDANRLAYNAFIRNPANWASLNIDGVIDFAADPRFATQAAAGNTTWYIPPGLHVTGPGLAALAGIAATTFENAGLAA